jgi:hypothetical protein
MSILVMHITIYVALYLLFNTVYFFCCSVPLFLSAPQGLSIPTHLYTVFFKTGHRVLHANFITPC